MKSHKSKFILSLFAFVALSLGSAMSARADIVIVSGNVPQPGDQNVLLNNGQTGNPIFGTTNQTGFQVRFGSNENLTAPSSGQARVEAADGAFSQLNISLPGATFTSLILNINALTAQTVNFVVTEPNGQTNPFSFALAAGGQNFFTITAILGQSISNVAFTTTGPVLDIRQVRIGGAQNIPTAVPEPATMLLLGTGLAGIAAKVRRRRKANQD
jgi:hypothetical protein